MKVHVLMEPALSPQLPAAVVPIATYGELHPGSSRVPVCLCNLGFMGYYLRFIPKFMQVAHPLHALTLGENKARRRLPLSGTVGVNRPLMT